MGTAHGLMGLKLDQSSLEQALAEGKISLNGTAQSIALTVALLKDSLPFSSPNRDDFQHKIDQARKGGMNYIIEAKLPGADDYITGRHLETLLTHVFPDQDYGVLYFRDGFHHFLDEVTHEHREESA